MILAAVNLLAFGIFVWDKWLAKSCRKRVPEWELFSLTAIGGAYGSIVAMLAVLHKTRKRRFLWKFYLCSAAGLVVFWWLLTSR